MPYRSDVDGLRGVAILIGIVFHYFPEVLPGGFIGVDCFFIISGFLITQIILEGVRSQRFSFLDFYARRIRRLFPSLFLILIFSYFVAWAGTTADEFQGISRHIAGGAFFFANFTMADEVDYFAKAAEFKPLLTLWSLSVEEQFYFLWPALLTVMMKFGLRIKAITSCLLVVFFIVAFNLYPLNPETSYYYPHFRFWELLAGCLLALFMKDRRGPESVRLRSSLSLMGFLLMMVSLLTITRADPVQLILPVAGTILMILGGMETWFNRKILSFQPLVLTGLISYCLYLWHWPLLSFVRVVFEQEPNVLEKFGLIALTFLVSYPSYKYLEIPSRRNRTKSLPIILASAVCLIGLLGAVTYSTELIPPRPKHRKAEGRLALFDQKLLKEPFHTNHLYLERRKAIRQGICHYGKKVRNLDEHLVRLKNCLQINPLRPAIVVLGDSYAADLYAALSRSYPAYDFLQITGAGCSFQTTKNSNCRKLLDYGIEFIEKSPVEAVILSVAWSESYSTDKFLFDMLKRTGKKVILAGPVPEYEKEMRLILEKRSEDEQLRDLIRKYLRKKQFPLNDEIRNVAEEYGFLYLDRLEPFCEGPDYCNVLSPKGEVYLIDSVHLSVPGMDHLGNWLKENRFLKDF